MVTYGDPTLNPTLSGKQKAKNQTLTGINNSDNELFGDVDSITGQAKGGSDTLKGGSNSSTGVITNILYGITTSARLRLGLLKRRWGIKLEQPIGFTLSRHYRRWRSHSRFNHPAAPRRPASKTKVLTSAACTVPNGKGGYWP